jgi:hypothetical protein
LGVGRKPGPDFFASRQQGPPGGMTIGTLSQLFGKTSQDHPACPHYEAHQERHKESAGSFGVSKAHIGIMGDRLLTVRAVTFGIVIPIAFLVIAWFSM